MQTTIPSRHTLRLQQHDYAEKGYYFITICTQNRVCWLSTIQHNTVYLQPNGQLVEDILAELPHRFPTLSIESYVIMPNHIHMMLSLHSQESMRAEQSPAPTIGAIVCAFKSLATKALNQAHLWHKGSWWQRGYYDHIIRNQIDYQNILAYIQNNPLRWTEDTLYHKSDIF